MPIGNVFGSFFGQSQTATGEQQDPRLAMGVPAGGGESGAHQSITSGIALQQRQINEQYHLVQQGMSQLGSMAVLSVGGGTTSSAEQFGQGAIIQYTGARPSYSSQPLRQTSEDYFTPLESFSREWLGEGLTVTEIVVPKDTYMRLISRCRIIAGAEIGMQCLSFYTLGGTIKITPESTKHRFDLEAYLETTETRLP